jgi:hypothetical protein
VEKYLIERRTGTGEWEPAGEVAGDKTEGTVTGLVEGRSYQFRVKAVNKAGDSSPSNPSKTIVAKSRRLPPKIDRAMMREVRVKRGAIIDFNVNGMLSSCAMGAQCPQPSGHFIPIKTSFYFILFFISSI